MSAAAGMARELEVVSKKIEETVSHFESKIPPEKKRDFNREKSGTLEALERNRESAARMDDGTAGSSEPVAAPSLQACIVSMSRVLPKLNEEEKRKIKDVRGVSERYDRKRQLLHPASETEFTESLWWLSQKGQGKDLDPLFVVKENPPFTSPKVLDDLSRAELGIIEKEFGELLNSFGLDTTQFARAVEATIRKGRAVTSPQLKRAFGVERPTQVIEGMREIKQTLEERMRPQTAARWLGTPLEVFGGMSPREALIEGKTFPVLHLLRRLDEGSHY